MPGKKQGVQRQTWHRRSESGASVLMSKRESAPDVVVNALVAGIYSGRYVPGQRLVEADLVKEYAVSRSSVREAIKRLVADGLVTLNLNRGASIRSLTRGETMDLMKVYEVLTGLSARLAAEQIEHGANKKRVRECQAELMSFRANGNVLAYLQARDRFYKVLIDVAGNKELAKLLPNMHVHLVRLQLRDFTSRAGEKQRLEDYRRVCDAVLSGNGDAAYTAMCSRIQHVVNSISALPDEAFAAA